MLINEAADPSWLPCGGGHRPASIAALRQRRRRQRSRPRNAQARRYRIGVRDYAQGKDSRDIPVLISASVLIDDEGQELGTV